MMKKDSLESIKYSVLFSSLFVCLNQYHFWFNCLVLPFIVFGIRIKYINDISVKNQFRLYSLLIVLVLITGLLGIGYIYPLKRLLEMLSCIIYCYVIYVNVSVTNNFVSLFKGLLIASLVLSVFLLYSYGDISTISLNFKEIEYGPGKNDSALHLFIGLFASFMLSKLTKKHLSRYFLIGSFFFVMIILTQSMKAILASFLFESILISSVIRNYKTISIFFISAILCCLYWVKDAIFDFLNTGFMRVVMSRILTLIGLEEYASIPNMHVTEGRENLIDQALDIFTSSPIWGVGLENTRLIMGTYSHNTYVELASGVGLGGPLLFIGLIFLCLFHLFSFHKSTCRNYFIFFIVILALFFANSLKIYSVQACIIFFVLSPFFLKLYCKKKYENKNTICLS